MGKLLAMSQAMSHHRQLYMSHHRQIEQCHGYYQYARVASFQDYCYIHCQVRIRTVLSVNSVMLSHETTEDIIKY